jgi:hypothetical protein
VIVALNAALAERKRWGFSMCCKRMRYLGHLSHNRVHSEGDLRLWLTASLERQAVAIRRIGATSVERLKTRLYEVETLRNWLS